MKLEFTDDPPIVLGLDALAKLLVERGNLKLDYGDVLCGATLEGGTLTVEKAEFAKMVYKEFTLQDLRGILTGCMFCTWAKDDYGNDVLACFG